MDEHRFDGLSRALGGAGSRRLAATALASGAAVSVLTHLRDEGVEAKNKKKKKKKPCPVCPEPTCAAGQIRVSGQCVTGLGTCAAGTSSCGLPIGQQVKCNNARDCTCYKSASGETRCGKAASDLQCGQCTSDAQCAGFGVGAFCVPSITNTLDRNCSCAIVGQGFCMLPC